VGYDLTTPVRVELFPGEVTRIDVGLILADDMDYSLAGPVSSFDGKAATLVPFFKVEGRSGLASKGIFPVGGIIDPSYRGELGVLLFNSTKNSFVLEKGARIAQLVCYHTLSPLRNSEVVFDEVKEVAPSDRDDRGFGSSGA
jgi:dUTPase